MELTEEALSLLGVVKRLVLSSKSSVSFENIGDVKPISSRSLVTFLHGRDGWGEIVNGLLNSGCRVHAHVGVQPHLSMKIIKVVEHLYGICTI